MLFSKIRMIDENFEVLDDMYVGVERDKITYISKEEPSYEDKKKYGEIFDGRKKILMPGFYNTHAHSPMSLLRGYGENLPLNRWLTEKIFPFEANLDGYSVFWGTMLSMAESIRCGIVSTTDMYYFIDDMVKAISISGTKNNICRAIANVFGDDPKTLPAFKEMSDAIIMYDGFNNGRIITEAGLHAEYTNDDRTVRAVVECAKELEVGIHVHIAETELETRECKERRNGMTPVEYFDSFGMFDCKTNAAHCVWLTDNDRDILARNNVTVASNPVSNMKLASGICNVPELYKKGINVSIGTDGPASNNSLDFFEEMKIFALCGKALSKDAAAMNTKDVLYSATRGGALAQGREDCGFIKEGFKADLIVIDTDVPNMMPEYDLLNNLVFSACGKDVCLTMVDGHTLYQNGEFLTIDLEQAERESKNCIKRILSKL